VKADQREHELLGARRGTVLDLARTTKRFGLGFENTGFKLIPAGS